MSARRKQDGEELENPRVGSETTSYSVPRRSPWVRGRSGDLQGTFSRISVELTTSPCLPHTVASGVAVSAGFVDRLRGRSQGKNPRGS